MEVMEPTNLRDFVAGRGAGDDGNSPMLDVLMVMLVLMLPSGTGGIW